jgi:hypothetical protein
MVALNNGAAGFFAIDSHVRECGHRKIDEWQEVIVD